MQNSITLTIPADLSDTEWRKIDMVYKMMPYWVGFHEDGCPYWFGDESKDRFLYASVEPSGLLFSGQLDKNEFDSWIELFKNLATKQLGFDVIDADE